MVKDDALAGWLAAALHAYQGAGEVVTESTVKEDLEIKFAVDGKQYEKIVSAVPKGDDVYVPMVRAVVVAFQRLVALPEGANDQQAGRAVKRLLDWAREDEAEPRSLVIAGTADSSGRGAATKLSAADYTKAVNKLATKEFPVEEHNCPIATQLGVMKTAVVNVTNGFVLPCLPHDPSVQPAKLQPREDVYGNMSADNTFAWTVTADGQSVLKPEAPHRKDPKTLYGVAHGYLLYWTGVMVVSTLVPDAGPLDPEYEVSDDALFLHPYFVARLAGVLARVVGTNMVSAAAFEDVMKPLMNAAINLVNFPAAGRQRATGDVALKYILDNLMQHVGLVRARIQHSIKGEETGDGEEDPGARKTKKRKPGSQGGGAAGTPGGGGPKPPLPNCKNNCGRV